MFKRASSKSSAAAGRAATYSIEQLLKFMNHTSHVGTECIFYIGMAPKVRLPLVVRLPMPDRPPPLVDRLHAPPLETFRFGGGALEWTDGAEALPYA